MSKKKSNNLFDICTNRKLGDPEPQPVTTDEKFSASKRVGEKYSKKTKSMQKKRSSSARSLTVILHFTSWLVYRSRTVTSKLLGYNGTGSNNIGSEDERWGCAYQKRKTETQRIKLIWRSEVNEMRSREAAPRKRRKEKSLTRKTVTCLPSLPPGVSSTCRSTYFPLQDFFEKLMAKLKPHRGLNAKSKLHIIQAIEIFWVNYNRQIRTKFFPKAKRKEDYSTKNGWKSGDVFVVSLHWLSVFSRDLSANVPKREGSIPATNTSVVYAFGT